MRKIVTSVTLGILMLYLFSSCATQQHYYLALAIDTQPISDTAEGTRSQNTVIHSNIPDTSPTNQQPNPSIYQSSESSKNNTKSPIVFDRQKFISAGIQNIETYIFLCSEKHYDQAFKWIETADIRDDAFDKYLKAIIYILQNKYSKSNEMLHQIDKDKLIVEKQLLLLDNKLRIEKPLGSIDYDYLIKAYQALIDEYLITPELKFQIEQRVKDIRYSL